MARQDGKLPVPEEDIGPRGPALRRRQKVQVWFIGILAALALLWTLQQTMWLTMPIVAAFFIAVAIWPIPRQLSRHLPSWLAWLGIAAAMGAVVLVLALFFAGLWYGASQVAANWQQYADEFQNVWQQGLGWLNGLSDRVFAGTQGGEDGQAVQDGQAAQEAAGDGQDGAGGAAATAGDPLGFVADYASTILSSIWHVVAILVLIFFFVLLMLVEGRIWHAKLEDATSADRTETWLHIFAEVGARFRWYVVVRAVLGLATGILYGLWLWIWSVDFVIVWALLAFLLNFIPTLGSLLAGILPVAFAFLQKDPGTALMIGAGVLAIEQVMGNYVDPRVQGRQLSLSPLVVLFMLMVWGWIWGVAGALLAVPITMLMVMIFARIPALAPIALALSAEPSRRKLAHRISSG